MELHELIRMTTLINRLAKRALFAEEQIVALEGQCAEWKRIADELKAERNAAKQEAVSARQDAVTRAEADRKRIDGLMIQAQDMRGKEAWSDVPNATQWVEDMRGNTEASHDTPSGKEAAEAAAEIKVDDVVEVVSASSCATFSTDIGRRGKVTYIGEKTVEGVPGYACPAGGIVSKRDVRKVPQ